MSWKKAIQKLVGRFGYRLCAFPDRIGMDPFQDMATFSHGDSPLILDVGANTGQTVQEFRKVFCKPRIHSFEPSPATFELLRQNTSAIPDTQLWNRAMGSSSGRMILQENDDNGMSSFLPLSRFGWGSVIKQTSVDVDVVDDFCLREHIDRIDILKSDTQGYDLEVFKGAKRMFQEERIGLVYSEVIFSDMYKGMASMSQIYDFLTNHDFVLVSLYRLVYKKRLASHTDWLFAHKSCVAALAESALIPSEVLAGR